MLVLQLVHQTDVLLEEVDVIEQLGCQLVVQFTCDLNEVVGILVEIILEKLLEFHQLINLRRVGHKTFRYLLFVPIALLNKLHRLRQKGVGNRLRSWLLLIMRVLLILKTRVLNLGILLRKVANWLVNLGILLSWLVKSSELILVVLGMP